MALTYSKMMTLGSSAVDFSLKGADSQTYTLTTFKDKQVLVLIFMCNHCPYVQATLDRMIALHRSVKDKSVQLVGINPNDPSQYPEDSFDAMVALSKTKPIPFPYLWDETQSVARAYGAVCTPDFFVYDRNRQLRYRGRLDDNWQDATQVTEEDLKRAITSLLAGKPVSTRQLPSMGCSIKWKKGQAPK